VLILIGGAAAAPVVVQGRQPVLAPVIAVAAILGALVVERVAGGWPFTDGTPQPRSSLAPSRASNSLFRGRTRELAHLIDYHDEQRRARDSGSADVRGPVVIAIHGKPGVGKSALAKQLARRLARRYRDGMLYANLGTAGGARAPSEVLGVLLQALGRDVSGRADTAGIDDTIERAHLFRSLTAKLQLLVVLDAARYDDQIRLLMPAGTGCAVIITSRRDLGTALDFRSYALQAPTADECVEILRATTQTDDGERPVCAAEIVELCGRLPLAIRAAGERVSMQDADLCQIADLLRSPQTRLEWLDFNGRSVRERIGSEYHRLLPTEQRALRMLTLVRSDSFVPWLAAPLLNIDVREAENLVAQLSTTQLLDNLGTDTVTGLARYAFNPVVRRFIEEEVQAQSEADLASQQRRLTDEYLGAVVQVLMALDPNLAAPPATPTSWFPIGATPARIASVPRRWVRHEYRQLLRTVQLAYDRQEWTIAARIAAWLGGCVSADEDQAAVLAMFDQAADAAARTEDPILAMDVQLARAAFLIAVERYQDAHEILNEVTQQVREAPAAGDTGRARKRVEATAWRLMGESYLQAGAYREARWSFEYAAACAEDAGDEAELRLVQLLQADNHQVSTRWAPSLLDDRSEAENDDLRFRIHLSSAEAAQGSESWEHAEDQLRSAESLCAGDAAATALTVYRLGRLWLRRWHAEHGAYALFTGDRAGSGRYLIPAIRFAAQAALTYRTIGNPVGELRARLLLGRALLGAGHVVVAEQLIVQADRMLPALPESAYIAVQPLLGLLRQAQGELDLRTNENGLGRDRLTEAASIFTEEHDWTAEQETSWLLTLGRESVDEVLAGSTAAPAHPVAVDRVEELAAAVANRLQERLFSLSVEPEPVSFHGMLAVALSAATPVGPDEPPVWRVPRNETCRLTFLVTTGATVDGDRLRLINDLDGPNVWRPVGVVNGRHAAVVDLDLVVDAPLLEVSTSRWQLRCRVSQDKVYQHSTVQITTPGRYDLQASLFCAGRLVQALPIQLLVDERVEP